LAKPNKACLSAYQYIYIRYIQRRERVGIERLEKTRERESESEGKRLRRREGGAQGSARARERERERERERDTCAHRLAL
jgi:hypothetical protein